MLPPVLSTRKNAVAVDASPFTTYCAERPGTVIRQEKPKDPWTVFYFS